MFGWEFPPHISGGLGTACQGIVRAMTDRKVPVTFVLPRKMPVSDVGAEFLFADVPWLEVEYLDSLLYPYITPEKYRDESLVDGGGYGRDLLSEVKRYGQIAGRLSKRVDFDIIHAHDWLTYPAGWAAQAVSGRPLVAHVHATEYDRTGNGSVNPDVYAIEREGMERADGVIAISNMTKDIVTNKYKIPASKVQVVHNGIEAEKYARVEPMLESLKAKGNKVVLFLGRITLQKGPDYFLEAAKKVLEVEPNVYFVMAGSGDMQQQCIRRAAEFQIADRVIFSGFARGKDVTRLYQAADLYVMSSISEPFGLIPLEAAAQGVPVLVSNQSGVSEVFHSCLKADFWDIDEMSNKIVSALRYPTLHQTLSIRGQQRARKLDWHRSVRGYLDYYNNILNVKIA